MARYNAKLSKRKYDANPQGIGPDQVAQLIMYYDAILKGYEEDVTGEPETLTGAGLGFEVQAPVPRRLGADITRDATLVGHAWTGQAYEAFKTAVTGRANSMGVAADLMRRTGTTLATISEGQTSARSTQRTIRWNFLADASKIASDTDQRAIVAATPTAGNIERQKGFKLVNDLGMRTVEKADAEARQFDTMIGAARAEFDKVTGDAGGDTYNPLAPTAPVPTGDRTAQLIYRNGFDDPRPRESAAEVQELQRALNNARDAKGQPLLDAQHLTGRWDAATQRAVNAYLGANNLPPYDPALADPSRLPPRFQALWPIMEQASRTHGIDPVYIMAILDRETGDRAPVGQALADGKVGLGAINKQEVGGGNGHGLGQIDAGSHAPWLEGNAYGYDPQTSIPRIYEVLKERLNWPWVKWDVHKALNFYNGGDGTDRRTSGHNYGMDTISRAQVFRRMLYGLDRTPPTAASPAAEPQATAQENAAFTANPDVLARLTNDLRDNAIQTAELVSWLRKQHISPQAFGSRPSSELTADSFHKAAAAVASKLRLDAKGVAEIAETVQDSANGYQGWDMAYTRRFSAP